MSSRRDMYNVRDCLYWPASLSDPNQRQYPQNSPYAGAGGNMSSLPSFTQQYQLGGQMTGHGNGSSDPYTFHTGATGDFQTSGPVQQPQRAPIKAYMSTPGEGGSLGRPVQIPCHMGSGAGQIPAIPNMPALGYKVTVPQIPPSDPIDFEIRQ